MPEAWDARFSVLIAPRVEVPEAYVPEPIPAPRPAPRGPSIAMVVLGVAVVIGVSAAAGWIAWELTSPEPPAAARAPNPSASAGAEDPGAASGASPSGPPSAPAAAVTASASASAAASAPEDPSACFASLLPPDAFGEPPPDLAPLCRETHAYRTMLKLKSELVKAGGREVTEAMKEWSKLGWYETAAFAVMRARCCPADAPPLTTPDVIAACKMDEALADLAKAVDRPEAMSEAARRFGEAATCISDKAYPDLFGRMGPPHGIEVESFSKVLERIESKP